MKFPRFCAILMVFHLKCIRLKTGKSAPAVLFFSLFFSRGGGFFGVISPEMHTVENGQSRLKCIRLKMGKSAPAVLSKPASVFSFFSFLG